MDEPFHGLHLSGKFLMCNGCGEATPMQPTVEDIRRVAATLGWTVEGIVSDPASEDYCGACSITRRDRGTLDAG
jgi:hypothetical protein